IFGLRTIVSRSLGLIPTLTEYLHEFSAQTGIQVSLNVLDEKGTRLTPTAEVQLIRIIQESLTNVRKHARSSSAIIRFDYKDGKGRIFIEDNGGGFEPSVHGKASSLHFGLQTMKERAQAAGGKLEIQSDPASGTQIIVTLPVIP
ncbi:MAG: histidine kinase, partial [Candidatus Tectomicrobia bacterium]|nr:histidine kinase [Candidatus Tectomicrobia bacterium]